MKARTSLLKRCLALALAVMLFASGTNLGVVLQAYAAGGESITVSYGKIVADNYDLTAAEKDLLSSGNLAGGSYSYTMPGEDLVTVDTDEHRITAGSHGDWVPTEAYIVVDGAAVETVTLTSGQGVYTYSENTFAVEVAYTLNVEVAADAQDTLLKTAGWLKDGIANIDKVNAQSSALDTLKLAMPDLVNLADNGYTVFGTTVNFDDNVKAAIYALNSQMTANGGELKMSLWLNEYASAKTSTLLNKGLELKAELEETTANIDAIRGALDTINTMIKGLPAGSIDATTVNLVNMLLNILTNWVNAAKPVIAAEWTAAQKGTALVSASVNYAQLDTLVAALGSITTATVKNPLHVADKTVKVNLNMYDVTVTVVLQVVKNQPDTADLVEHGRTEPVKLTLSDGATQEQILAAVLAAGVEANAQALWAGVYDTEHFATSTTTLPDSLTEDIAYTITYAPKSYTVTLSYGEPMNVPYGYQYTLPRHEDDTKAYDYTVNGVKKAQGSVYTITGDTEISRAAGKAYTSTDLYTVIADNYGNAVAQAILKSGALKNNEAINVRKPDAADSESLIALVNDKLKVLEAAYPADYQGLNWVPYTYGTNGTENEFGGATEVNWTESSAKVKYILVLSNYTEADVQAVETDIADLKTEAAAQKATLDRLAAKYSVMGQLDRTKLGALNGVIGVTDLNADPDKNAALKAEFTTMVNGIINNNLDGTNLRIYAQLGGYLADGLSYYYNNSTAVINEINTLSGYLTGMLDNPDKVAALEILVTAAGYPEYKDKITDLEGIMSEVKAALTAPNAMINLSSSNLYKLIEALESDQAVSFSGSASPYLISDTLSATDASQVIVQVFVDVNGKSETFTTEAQDRGYVLQQNDVSVLITDIEAFVKGEIGTEKFAHYQVSGMDTLNALVGTALEQRITNVYLTYSPIEYTITIEGVGDKTVTIESAQVELPGHATKGWVYRYNAFGTTIDVGFGETKAYTVKAADLASGVRTITRTEVNKVLEDFENVIEGMETLDVVIDAGGNITAITATVDGSMTGLRKFATELTSLGYSYIELNDGVLMETDESTLVSIQVLLDAILMDNTFGSQTLININQNNGGKIFSGVMDLGNAVDDITFEGVNFTFKLDNAPAKLGTVADGLNRIKDYMTFNSQDGELRIDVTLPEKVYEVYLTALLATGRVDKTDMNAMNDEIAYMFLWDYIDLIINTNATTTTYTNTLRKLNIDRDLTRGEEFYQLMKRVLTGDSVTVNQTPNDGIFDIAVDAKGKETINALLDLVNRDPSEFSLELALIKEYQDGESLSFTTVATLGNTPSSYEAVILDVDASGAMSKFDYTENLPARVGSIAGQAVVMLLDDVDGNLTFPGTTILDLNGCTVNGNVSSTGKLYIVDSLIETRTTGSVTGTVQANAILGGKFTDTAGATAALKSGYKLVDGYVQNALYTVEYDGTNITYVMNTDALSDDSVTAYGTFAKSVAVDTVVDLALNFFTAASLTVDGSNVYTFDFGGMIALLESGSKVDTLINKTLDTVNAAGISTVVNTILADLLDFASIETALNSGDVVASYAMSTSPWFVDVEHVTNGDYIDIVVNTSSDASLVKNFNLKIKFAGANTQAIANLAGELAQIVDANQTHVTVALDQPTYANKTISISGGADVAAVVDMSGNADYATAFGVILAYGNSAKRAAVKDAINAGSMADLKAVVDDTTVEELFTALKRMNRGTNFAAMANAVGVTADVTSAGTLEAVYHLVLCATGKALETANITGRSSKLGTLYNEDTGFYELSKQNIFRSADMTARNITAEGAVELNTLNLKIKLFPIEHPLCGDVNHDGTVTPDDATAILQYFVGLNPNNFCTLCADVDGDGRINPDDATYILQYCVGLIDRLPLGRN